MEDLFYETLFIELKKKVDPPRTQDLSDIQVLEKVLAITKAKGNG